MLTRKAGEREKSDEMYRLLVDESPLGVVVVGRDGRNEYVNARFTQILGYGLEDIPDAQTWFRKAFPDEAYREKVVSAWRSEAEASEPGRTRSRTFTVRCADGKDKTIHFRSVTMGREGQFVVCEDITERQQAQRALQHEHDFVTALIQESPAFYVAITPEGHTRMMSRAMLDALGYSADEIVGRDYVSTVVPARERDAVAAIFRELNAGQVTKSENHIVAKDGRELLVEWRGVPVRGDDGQIEFVFGVGIDITERRRAGEELRRSENLYRALFESSADGIFLMDGPRIVDCNPKGLEMYGITRDEIVEMTPFEFSPAVQPDGQNSREKGVQKLELTRAGIPQSFEWRHFRRDGSLFDVEVSLARVEMGGRFLVVAGTRDISERKQAEETRTRLERQLVQAQKMEAIGTLAGGIAHDFNNMLQAIGGYADMLPNVLTDNPRASRYAERIRSASTRAQELVAQILTFSRQTGQPQKPVDICPIIEEALKLLRGSLPPTIEIQETIPSCCPPVLADPIRIQQVVMNLATNAYHAMRDSGGVLRVQLERIELLPAQAEDIVGSKPGPHLRLRVGDTGPGISPTSQDRIFDPFFTTKPVGEGTGLGLSTVHGIVTGLGGTITVDSPPGEGATFTVLLPEYEGDGQGEAPPSAVPAADLEGTEHVLFVDDEETLVELVSAALGALGYRVSGFSDAIGANAALQANPGGFDIVVSDVMMPQMTGLELVRFVRGLRPNLPVILWSGYSEDVDERVARQAGASEYLQKPVSPFELAAAIRRALDRGGEDGGGQEAGGHGPAGGSGHTS